MNLDDGIPFIGREEIRHLEHCVHYGLNREPIPRSGRHRLGRRALWRHYRGFYRAAGWPARLPSPALRQDICFSLLVKPQRIRLTARPLDSPDGCTIGPLTLFNRGTDIQSFRCVVDVILRMDGIIKPGWRWVRRAEEE